MSNVPAPFRAEVFSIERLEEYARTWAQQDQPWPPNRRGQRLLARLAENDRVLLAAQSRFSEAVRLGKPLSTSAEWLLDNFYVVQEQLREVTEDLSRNYYNELPKVANRYGNGYPRVYGIALELLTHTDSRLDAETIERFVKAYQTTAPLTLGELWAVAIMLRVALVENLRRLVDDALDELEKREQADAWVEQFRQSPGTWRGDPIATLAAKSNGGTALDPVFGVHLLQLLRDADPALLPAIRWLENHLRAEGQHIEDVIRNEHLRRAANRVSVGNVITTMRTLALVDWPAFVENTSQVEQLLRTDPARMYDQMNFETRDQYRHVIERIARRAGGRRPYPRAQPALERSTTEKALSLAREAEDDPRRGHVGYYLLGRGYSRLEAEMRYRLPWRERLSRAARARPLLLYSGLIALVTTGLLAGALGYAASANAAPLQLLLRALL
jgi:hypothetical protein